MQFCIVYTNHTIQLSFFFFTFLPPILTEKFGKSYKLKLLKGTEIEGATSELILFQ